jgi:hypothetical protein
MRPAGPSAPCGLGSSACAPRGGGEPFQELSLAELVRLTATAGRAFAQVAQVERLAHGLSTENRGGHDSAAIVPLDVQRKSTAELEAYLTGRAEVRQGP